MDTSPGKRPTDRRELLLLILLTLFIGFFVTAELLGAKLFHFTLFGLSPASLGFSDTEFVATTGILAFPLTFILTDVINEFFGKRIVRQFTFLALAVNAILQIVVQAAIRVPARSFTPGITHQQVQDAYSLALGQTWSIVVASMVAFLIGQWLDAQVFTYLRRRTGGRLLWLRSQGSTIVSQWIDSYVVIVLAFVVLPMVSGGSPWPMATALAVATTNYVYKFAIAVGSTPVLYFAHSSVKGWLGVELAERMAHEAHPRDPE
ncbi:MAG TPA: queuosine precursor transporter [Planctomycetota bacterium]|nr:queuosine precursor transporter [Planctomycetota bacterium]